MIRDSMYLELILPLVGVTSTNRSRVDVVKGEIEFFGKVMADLLYCLVHDSIEVSCSFVRMHDLSDFLDLLGLFRVFALHNPAATEPRCNHRHVN